jgi:transposase
MHWLPARERAARNKHILELYNKGFSLRQVASRVGLQEITIYAILKKQGVKKVHDYPRQYSKNTDQAKARAL